MLFFWLLVGHGLMDYPLQGDFLARAKNHRAPIPGVPWMHGLFWHALLHGGAVAFVTQSVAFGLSETVAHMVIDYLKCDGRFGGRPERAFHIDQALHVACKVLWGAAA